MRTLVDIPHKQLIDLTSICEARKLPRAEVIRQALAAYIEANKVAPMENAFGLWKNHAVDGMVYQEQVRSEW
jgi:hypothetical protein